MKKRHLLPAFILLLALPLVAEASKLRVPKDFPTVQGAVDASLPGDVIVISKGTYSEAIAIVGKNNLTVMARKGHKVTIDAQQNGSPLSIFGSSDVSFLSLRFQNSNSVGASAVFSSNVMFDRCRVTNVAAQGIVVSISSGIRVEKCRITHTGGNGIELFVADSLIRGNVVNDIGGKGISMSGAVSTIQDNRIENTGEAGIVLGDGTTGCQGVLVMGNKLKNIQGDGVLLDVDALENTVMGNSVKKIAVDGIRNMPNAGAVVISGNKVGATGDDGIEVASKYALVGHNAVSKAGRDGLRVHSTATYGIWMANKVKKSEKCGLLLLEGSQFNLIANNVISKSGVYDLRDESGSPANSFMDNSFNTVSP